MNRSIISLLVAGLFAGMASASFAQNVTAPDKSKEPGTVTGNQKETTTNPHKADGTAHMSKHAKGDAAFTKADKDKDGTLDKTEAKAMPRVSKNFDAIDTDKDGTVSLDEVHTYMKARHSAAHK